MLPNTFDALTTNSNLGRCLHSSSTCKLLYGRSWMGTSRRNHQSEAITAIQEDQFNPATSNLQLSMKSTGCPPFATTLHLHKKQALLNAKGHLTLILKHHDTTTTPNAIPFVQGLHSLCRLLRNLHGPIHLHIHHTHRTEHVEAAIQSSRRRPSSEKFTHTVDLRSGHAGGIP